jgi:anti-sigma-K factor RskA
MPCATDTAGVKEMKSIASADAFAVTLEPMGGSINPTMDQMVVWALPNKHFNLI